MPGSWCPSAPPGCPPVSALHMASRSSGSQVRREQAASTPSREHGLRSEGPPPAGRSGPREAKGPSIPYRCAVLASHPQRPCIPAYHPQVPSLHPVPVSPRPQVPSPYPSRVPTSHPSIPSLRPVATSHPGIPTTPVLPGAGLRPPVGRQGGQALLSPRPADSPHRCRLPPPLTLREPGDAEQVCCLQGGEIKACSF